MNTENGTVHDRAKAVSDAAIRRSLLGCADTSEQAAFETFLMLDEQFGERVYRLELELSDDFCFGNLSKAEQRLFNTRFLVTRARLRGLAVSQALAQSTSKWESQSEQVKRHSHPSFLKLFAPDGPFFGPVLAAAALVIFGFLFWLSLKVPSQRAPLISKRQQPAASRERQFAHPLATPSSEIKSAADKNSTQQPIVINLLLHPDRGSSNRQSLNIANSIDEAATVRLDLVVENTDKISYQANLTTEAGQQLAVFSEPQAAAEDPTKIVLHVPASLLKDGIYYVDLMWTYKNTSQSLRYSFQVEHD